MLDNTPLFVVRVIPFWDPSSNALCIPVGFLVRLSCGLPYTILPFYISYAFLTIYPQYENGYVPEDRDVV